MSLPGFVECKFDHGIDPWLVRTESHEQFEKLFGAVEFTMDSRNLKYSSARAIVPIPIPSMFLLCGTGVTRWLTPAQAGKRRGVDLAPHQGGPHLFKQCGEGRF